MLVLAQAHTSRDTTKTDDTKNGLGVFTALDLRMSETEDRPLLVRVPPVKQARVAIDGACTVCC